MDHQSFAFTEHLITQQNSQHNSVLHKGRSAAPPLAAPVVVVVAGGLNNSSDLLLNHLKSQRLPELLFKVCRIFEESFLPAKSVFPPPPPPLRLHLQQRWVSAIYIPLPTSPARPGFS
jgi:hypothetical protein